MDDPQTPILPPPPPDEAQGIQSREEKEEQVQKQELQKAQQRDRDKQQKALEQRKKRDTQWKQRIREQQQKNEATSTRAHVEGLQEEVLAKEKHHQEQKEWRTEAHEHKKFLENVQKKKEETKMKEQKEEEEKKEKNKARKEYFDTLHAKGQMQHRIQILAQRKKVEGEAKENAEHRLQNTFQEIDERRTRMLLEVTQEEQAQRQVIAGDLLRKKHNTDAKLMRDLAALDRDRRLALSRAATVTTPKPLQKNSLDLQREFERRRLELQARAQQDTANIEAEETRKLSILNGEMGKKRMKIEEEIRRQRAYAERLTRRAKEEAELKTRMAEEHETNIAKSQAMDAKFVKGEEGST